MSGAPASTAYIQSELDNIRRNTKRCTSANTETFNLLNRLNDKLILSLDRNFSTQKPSIFWTTVKILVDANRSVQPKALSFLALIQWLYINRINFGSARTVKYKRISEWFRESSEAFCLAVGEYRVALITAAQNERAAFLSIKPTPIEKWKKVYDSNEMFQYIIDHSPQVDSNRNIESNTVLLEEDDDLIIIDPHDACDHITEIMGSNYDALLVCPLSLQYIDVPARGVFCKHKQCFDLRTFIEIGNNKTKHAWRCPTCHEKLTKDTLKVDSVMSIVLREFKERFDGGEMYPAQAPDSEFPRGVRFEQDGSWSYC
jgi:hypothetical protein